MILDTKFVAAVFRFVHFKDTNGVPKTFTYCTCIWHPGWLTLMKIRQHL